MNKIVQSKGFMIQRKVKLTHKTNFDDERLIFDDERERQPFIISRVQVVTIILWITIAGLLSVINQKK